MPIALSTNAGTLLAPPGGYPIALGPQSDYVAEGVVPLSLATVSATVALALGYLGATKNTVLGTANVYAALFAPPPSSGQPDGPEITGTRVSALGLTGDSQTLTVTVPTGSALAAQFAAYVTPAGTATATASSTAVSGSGTAFLPIWPGYQIRVGGAANAWQTIASITNATAIVLSGASAYSASGSFDVRFPSPPCALIFRAWVDRGSLTSSNYVALSSVSVA